MRHRSARLLALLLCILLACSVLGGCAQVEPQKYSTSFFDVFDTVITIIGYADSQETFDRVVGEAQQQFVRYHQVFDGYNAYDGVHNLYYVNQNAASGPVPAEPELMTLLAWIRDLQPSLEGRVNVAMGAVLRLWHDAREVGVALPDEAALREAAGHVDMSQVILDEQAGTVYFADPELSLDLGAVAKGYTAERVAQWMLGSDMPSFIISAGGNVRCGQKPLDGRARWGVGIQDPGPIDGMAGTGYMDVLYLTNLSVVTSGDYQRYYTVDGERDHHLNDPDTLYTVDGVRYHHLIDPDTLYPGRHMRAVTIVTQDSGLADALSTAVFLMPYEQGRAFVEALDGVEAYWVLLDGSVQCTDGLRAMLASQGASSRD